MGKSMAGKDCPMCAETMRVHEKQSVMRVAGTSETKTTTALEWVCPECDYYEEVDEEDVKGGSLDGS